MKLIAITIGILFSSNVFASQARIHATNEDQKSIHIQLDAKGTPRESLDTKRYPSIKDFRDDHAYYDACYAGPMEEVKDLLEQLVIAADGDGDSYAELRAFFISLKNEIKVIAFITDESGEKEESFTFPPCVK